MDLAAQFLPLSALVALISAAVAGTLARYGRRWLLDHPGQHRSHEVPTPRGGGLAIVIALFGIANTLGLSIIERRHELGLLRAVGMSRRQLRSSVRWESVIIALLGTLLGLVIGVVFAWAMVKALADQGIDKFSVAPGQLLIIVILAGLFGVLAAAWPARRAAKLDVLSAIQS